MITPSAYDLTMAEFNQHFTTANTKLTVPLILTLPDYNISMTQVQFAALRTSLLAQQDVVQTWLVDVQIARGNVNVQKAALLAKFGQFASLMDASYQGTGFYAARPFAPSLTDGKEVFCKPLGDAMKLWKRMDEGAAPAGVTLPLALGDGTTQGTFASLISSLAFAYADLEGKEVDLRIARGDRNVIQKKAYAGMLVYREGAACKFVLHPELIESLPRLTPLPGHTPEAVNASAVFVAPDNSKIIHDASDEPTLERYELRGCAGPDWNEEDAVLVGTHLPNVPREFLTDFALNQPGAAAVFKVYVILTTGNEAGSAPLAVQRPLAQVA